MYVCVYVYMRVIHADVYACTRMSLETCIHNYVYSELARLLLG